MQITINGKLSADPKDRILALEAVTRSICERYSMDPAEGVMMLLTAAAHLTSTYSKKPAERNLETLAVSLGAATVAADDFFKLRPLQSKGGSDD